MRKLLSNLTAVLVFAFIVDSAMAQATATWNGSVNSNWATAGNWTVSGGGSAPPASSDLVVIPDQNNTANDPTVGVSGSYAQLRVEARGYVQVNSSNTLTITGSGGLDIDPANGAVSEGVFDVADGTLVLSGGGTNPIDGKLLLSHASAVLSVTSASPTLNTSSSGHVQGTNASAEIRIAAEASQRTLTSNVRIHGMLKIRGMAPGGGQLIGKFVNGASGIIDADANGVLSIMEGEIDDASGAAWRVTHANGTLEFLVSPNCLDGNFTVAPGTLDASPVIGSVDVRTIGRLLSMLNGSIQGNFQAGPGVCP